MKIFLIGFMGSGKTTTGRKLASKLNKQLVDMDEWIEKEEQMPVQEIFNKKGENHFRELESKYLRELAGKDELIVATGGGLPCHSNNMEFMNREGLTVYLKMNPEELFSRLKESRNERPLLKNKDREETLNYIKMKLADREWFYNKAQLIVPGFNLNTSALVKKIKASQQ